MRVFGRRTAMLGAAALVVALGGCTRQSQPPATPPATPPASHECPQPVPTGVVYHQAQDRWEVLLAAPDAAAAEPPQTLPLRTYTPYGVVEGFVPSSESFRRVYGNDRITGPFPALVEFKQGRWVVHARIWTITEQPLVNDGFYGARIVCGSSQTRYSVTLTGQQIPID